MSAHGQPRRTPGQSVTCAWCGTSVAIARTGRVPKWCSAACRQRAWVHRQSVAADARAVEVVERVIQTEVERTVTVVEHVDVPIQPRGSAWPATLAELVKQLDSGRVYDRDLMPLAESVNEVLKALERRPAWQRVLRWR